MSAHVIHLPVTGINDAPSALRALADGIERGEWGAAHQVAYVVDTGDGFVQVGMAGKSASPGAEAHLLLSMGMRKLENLVRDDVMKEAS